jgi:2-oxoglutarate-dependent dioxygenase
MTVIESAVAPLQLSEGEVRFYKEEGYLFLPGLLNESVIDAIREEVLDVMEASGRTREELKTASGSSDKLIQSSQYLQGSHLDALANSPNLNSIAAKLMEGPSTLYLPFTAVKAGGGGGRFHFHKDNQYTRFDGPGINIWIALSPMSPENGCLQVVPRTHLNGTMDSVENSDGDGHRTVANDPTRFLPIRMRAGDAVAFSRLTLHGSGSNQTDEPRVAYAVQFHRDDVRATWDGEMHLLKEHPRWQNIAAVNELTPPQNRSQDGH